MAELVWGGIGQRYFESGIDRGVLYPRVGPGVAWNGLTAVDEKPDGGSPRPFYADGYKYLNLSSAEEYSASISAFSAPDEFAACDGTQSVLNGLFITQQRRQSFGLSYRTITGNDVDGIDHGYKIHLIYNALASATSRNYQTIGNSPSPIGLSWDITTTPPEITGYRPSAHFIIDSRYTPTILMAQFEGMLYGTSYTDPYLPTVAQLMEQFNSLVTIQMLKEQLGGTFAFESVPAIQHSIKPTPAPGQSVLWLDTSAVDYDKLTLVTGE
jgi:hypothetical protein